MFVGGARQVPVVIVIGDVYPIKDSGYQSSLSIFERQKDITKGQFEIGPAQDATTIFGNSFIVPIKNVKFMKQFATVSSIQSINQSINHQSCFICQHEELHTTVLLM